MKKALKILRNIIVICILLVVVFFVVNICYLALSYSRIPDNQNVETSHLAEQNYTNKRGLQNGMTYSAISYNIGFSAYTPDFSFFMDGGSQSWANSKESVIQTTSNISNLLSQQNTDFISLQEVDSDSTRTYHVNEVEQIQNSLQNYSSLYACCFNSPFLFWPPWQPHGLNKSNIMTLSKFNPSGTSIRKSLPVDDSFTKILDYDRCYTVTRYDIDNGKELVWYTTHTSAYAKDPETSNKQLEIIIKEMQKEFEKGNYAVCAADFNKEIVPNIQNYFSSGLIPDTPNFPSHLLQNKNVYLIAPFKSETPIPSCRSAKEPLNGKNPVSCIDGFLVSSNIDVVDTDAIDTNFAYSDHNPVYMKFKLM